jgi:hypothetical protein
MMASLTKTECLQEWNFFMFLKAWRDFTLYQVPSRYTGETRGEVYTKIKCFCLLKYC